MLVKYCLNDNIKIPFEDSSLGLQDIWTSPMRTNCL